MANFSNITEATTEVLWGDIEPNLADALAHAGILTTAAMCIVA